MEKTKKVIYLDNAATTQLSPEARSAMEPFLEDIYANPSAMYESARAARRCVDDARERVAESIGAHFNEIVFTGGGSEADALAIIGTALSDKTNMRHIITSKAEHHAVLNSVGRLESMGFRVTYLPVDRYARVNPKDLEAALTDDTLLVSIMSANNETGAINPIKELVCLAHGRGALFHTDAVQATGHIPVDVADLGADYLSLSAHKFHGPKGVGALYIRKGLRPMSLIPGGSQEKGFRAGTENVAGIVGMGVALAEAAQNMTATNEKTNSLRELFKKGLADIDGIEFNTPEKGALPQILNVTIKGMSADTMLVRLDEVGICASAGAACSAGAREPSHVLMAAGLSREDALCSIRFSFSGYNTEDEVALAAQKVRECAGG